MRATIKIDSLADQTKGNLTNASELTTYNNNPVVAWSNGQEYKEGEITERSATSLVPNQTVSGTANKKVLDKTTTSYLIPKGYYKEDMSVSVDPASFGQDFKVVHIYAYHGDSADFKRTDVNTTTTASWGAGVHADRIVELTEGDIAVGNQTQYYTFELEKTYDKVYVQIDTALTHQGVDGEKDWWNYISALSTDGKKIKLGSGAYSAGDCGFYLTLICVK